MTARRGRARSRAGSLVWIEIDGTVSDRYIYICIYTRLHQKVRILRVSPPNSAMVQGRLNMDQKLVCFAFPGVWPCVHVRASVMTVPLNNKQQSYKCCLTVALFCTQLRQDQFSWLLAFPPK